MLARRAYYVTFFPRPYAQEFIRNAWLIDDEKADESSRNRQNTMNGAWAIGSKTG